MPLRRTGTSLSKLKKRETPAAMPGFLFSSFRGARSASPESITPNVGLPGDSYEQPWLWIPGALRRPGLARQLEIPG
jgi:hypothetical protein